MSLIDKRSSRMRRVTTADQIKQLILERNLRPGDRLKVIPGPFEALIDLDRYHLTLVVGGLYAGRFSIGVGKDHTTPVGTFTVKGKVLNPTWYGPLGPVAHGDNRNPLGGRWIDLGDGIGIHGTNNPATIGRNDSDGCLRLASPDIEDVYDILVEGSRVVVQGASRDAVPGAAASFAARWEALIQRGRQHDLAVKRKLSIARLCAAAIGLLVVIFFGVAAGAR